jgi:DNA-directed RNA polymerase subunit RPC12/RpoP
MRKVLVEAARARLLSEGRTVACIKCWEFVDTVKVRDLVRGFTCPECGSRLIGMVGEGQERVEILAGKMRMKRAEAPKKMRRLHSRLTKSAELFSKHGFPAAVVLAGRGIGPSEGEAILRKESAITDRLVELVIDAERLFLKRRYFMPKHTEIRRS